MMIEVTEQDGALAMFMRARQELRVIVKVLADFGAALTNEQP